MLLITHTMNFVLRVKNLTIGFADNSNPLAVLLNVLFLHGLFPFCNNNVMAGGWYVGTIMLLYYIAPFIYRRLRHIKHYSLLPILSFVLALVFGAILKNLVGIADVTNNNSFYYYSVIVQLPCFLLGMILRINKRKNKKSLNVISVGILFVVISFLCFFYEVNEYRFIVAVTLIAYGAYYLLYFFENRKTSCRIVEAFGKKSYYIYLVHFFFVWTMPAVLQEIFNIQRFISSDMLYMILLPIMIVGSYMAAIILEKLCKPLENCMKCLMAH